MHAVCVRESIKHDFMLRLVNSYKGMKELRDQADSQLAVAKKMILAERNKVDELEEQVADLSDRLRNLSVHLGVEERVRKQLDKRLVSAFSSS